MANHFAGKVAGHSAAVVDKFLDLNAFLDKLVHFNWSKLGPFAITWGIFLLVGIATYVYQYFKYKKQLGLTSFIGHIFPFSGWFSKSTFMDLVLYAVAHITRRFMSTAGFILYNGVAFGVMWSLTQIFPHHQALQATVWSLILVTVIVFICADFANFLTHYLQHTVPFLWELHKVHHSALFLSPLTVYRHHPFSGKLEVFGGSVIIGLPAGVAAFLYGMTFEQIFMLCTTTILYTNILRLESLRHSQFPISFGWFDRILISPHMHQLHHSARPEHWNKNMGVRFTVWDWMFGTAMIPDKNEPLTYGIGRGPEMDREYESVYGVYVHPLVRMFQILTGRKAPLPNQPESGAETAAKEEASAFEHVEKA